MKRLVLAALLILSLVAVPMGAVAQDGTNTTTATPTETASTPTPAAGDSEPEGPTAASQVRVTPVQFDEDFLGVAVNQSDSVFETTGPFAVFSLSQSVEAARVQQQPANAEVLAGGRQVRVDYDDDAAPLGEKSLYTLELFFEDGSTKEITLYARKTGVSVGASELQEYAPVIEELKEVSEAHGYGTSPDELQVYLGYINDRADLVEGFLTEKAAQLMGLAIAAATNWLFWVLLLAGIALLAKWIQRRYGGLLEALQNDVGRAERERRELELAYREQRQTADEVPLEDIPAVGSNAIYWQDGLKTRSAGQLARLAALGAHRKTDDGLEQVHDGVADLEPGNIENSWLEPVLRGNRIPTAKQALGEVKATLEYMETEYNLGHLYRDARDDVAQLIEELDNEDKMAFGPSNHGTGSDD
ncbi:hypothetical protein HWV23_03415 [Natronomonas halophila]|uniref:hypothetical protein n=1 Tax=Natronomonas halophila TaxID=2747817 RepID=UPI0015B6C494|nr:hypothetical protein [Natronomonas halophila]QLD84800.1 hypothetical protein HWV23_03415 [Natronomonas halophila]